MNQEYDNYKKHNTKKSQQPHKTIPENSLT
jgi:hypothetical protein